MIANRKLVCRAIAGRSGAVEAYRRVHYGGDGDQQDLGILLRVHSVKTHGSRARLNKDQSARGRLFAQAVPAGKACERRERVDLEMKRVGGKRIDREARSQTPVSSGCGDDGDRSGGFGLDCGGWDGFDLQSP